MRTACYIDGFNLYHAIEALNQPALKWADLSSLAQSYMREGDVLVRTVFFTALNTWDAPKRSRHVNYISALEAYGVEVSRSKFDKVQKYCHAHQRYCKLREEKQTDVALGVTMLSDCMKLGIQRIILLTADSDQIPAVKAVKEHFAETVIFMVAPPKRLKIARELGAACDGIAELSAARLRQHLLPNEIRDGSGHLIASRPASYGDRFNTAYPQDEDNTVDY